MNLSRLVTELEKSPTAEIFAQAKAMEQNGTSVIHLEIGQPDYYPPQPVLDSIIQATNEKFTQYTRSKGIPPLLQSIAQYVHATTKTQVTSEKEIIATSGGKHGLFTALFTITNPNDEIIIPTPSWVSYPTIVKGTNGTPVFVNFNGPEFTFDINLIQEAITPRSKAIIINSPNNPTGQILTKQDIKALYDLAQDHDLFLVSDEIYQEYAFSKPFTSLLEFPEWNEHAIIINGFSKTFSMTGLRLGWVIAQDSIISQINKVIQFTTSCPTSIIQKAGITALENVDLARQIIKTHIPSRISLVQEKVATTDTLTLAPIQGAMYAFVKLNTRNDDLKFANELLEKANVAITPGTAFGPAGKGYIRISLGVNEDKLGAGIDKIIQFLES